MALTADIVNVTPDPRIVPVSSVQVTFNQAATHVTLSAFRLTRDGVNIPLVGPAQSVSGTGTSYFLNGLATLTSLPGTYAVSIPSPSGIESGVDGSPLNNSPSDAWGQVEPWAGVTTCFRTAHLQHQSGIPTTMGGGLARITINSLVWNGTQYVVTLTTLPTDQDWVAGDFVAIEEQTNAPTCTGLWKLVAVTSNQVTLEPPPQGPANSGTGNNGFAARWHPARWNSLCTFNISAAGLRGLAQGVSLPNSNFFVPHSVSGDIQRIATAVKGTDYPPIDPRSKVRLTFAANHGFSPGATVEVAGLRVSDGSEIAHGWWVVSVINPTTIELDNSVWPGTGGIAGTGIVSPIASAVANRANLLTGDSFNAAAPTITNASKIDDAARGYQQGMDDFRNWFESHTPGKKAGYYFSGSAVSTPHAILERGINAGYPMIVTPLDKDFTNGWAISTSQSASGKLQLTIAAGRTPPAAWANKVRVAIFGHSNTSYCTDPSLDKVSSLPVWGGTGLRKRNGFVGTASVAGTTTTLTDTSYYGTFPYWLVGCQLLLEDGANAGQSRLIVSVNPGARSITAYPAFSAAIAAGVKYRAGHFGFPVTAVSGQNITLDTPYQAANGTGGVLMVMGYLSKSGNSVIKGGPVTGGDATRLVMDSDHGLAVNDYVAIFDAENSPGVPNRYNCNGGALVDGSDGMTVHKVVAATATTVDIDKLWVAPTGSKGRWYGTCLSLIAGGAGPQNEQKDEGRIDAPDVRRTDVKNLFMTKLKALITSAYTDHTARNIGFLDECAFRYTTSPGTTLVSNGAVSGESTEQVIDRIGELGDWLQTTWNRKMTVNVTASLTRDTFSPSQRAEVISRWGGMMSEGACFLTDRSVYQMGGTDGYLGHIAALLAGDARYYYAPQEIGGDSGIALVDIASSGANGNSMQVTTSGDSGTAPVQQESTNEGTTPHNRSGSIVGIFGHSVAAVNGVHRVRSRQASNQVTLETRAAGSAGLNTGKLVHCPFAPPLKITAVQGLAPSGTRITTEFPHNIPVPTDELTSVRVFGYADIPTDVVHRALRVSDTQLDLPDITAASSAISGICFYCRADLWHWLGLSYMLWQPGKALEYASGGVGLAVNTPRAYIPGPPTALSPDGAYTVTDFSGELVGIDGALPRKKLLTNFSGFTDAVLGEQVLINSGANNNEWRRILSYSSTTLTVDSDFPSNFAIGDKFVVGKIALANPTKVLQLRRAFNGNTRSVEVYPQKCAVKYFGF